MDKEQDNIKFTQKELMVIGGIIYAFVFLLVGAGVYKLINYITQ